MDKYSKIDIFVREFTEKYDFPKITYGAISHLAEDYYFIFSESSLHKDEKKELLIRLCENLRSMDKIQSFLVNLNIIKEQPRKQNLEGVVMELHPKENYDDYDKGFPYNVNTEDYILDNIVNKAVERYINYDSPEEKISWN